MFRAFDYGSILSVRSTYISKNFCNPIGQKVAFRLNIKTYNIIKKYKVL